MSQPKFKKYSSLENHTRDKFINTLTSKTVTSGVRLLNQSEALQEKSSENTSRNTCNGHDFCRKCGGFIKWDMEYVLMYVLMSSPPKYRGKCELCGERPSAFCHVINGQPEPEYFTKRKEDHAKRLSDRRSS